MKRTVTLKEGLISVTVRTSGEEMPKMEIVESEEGRVGTTSILYLVGDSVDDLFTVLDAIRGEIGL